MSPDNADTETTSLLSVQAFTSRSCQSVRSSSHLLAIAISMPPSSSTNSWWDGLEHTTLLSQTKL